MIKLRFTSRSTETGKSRHTRNSYSSNFRRLAGLLSLLPTSLFAATGLEGLSDAELRAARWYQVELIVFAHNNKSAAGDEHWQAKEGVRLPNHLVDLSFPLQTTEPVPQAVTRPLVAPAMGSLAMKEVPGTAAGQPGLPPLPTPFEMLQGQDLQLNSVAEKLRKSSLYEPLLHVAWRQPTFDRGEAQPVLLYEGMDASLPETPQAPAGDASTSTLLTRSVTLTPPRHATEQDAETGAINPRFVGTVELSVARYLHLKTDLFYRTMTTQQAVERVADSLLWFDKPYPTLRSLQGPAYQIRKWQAMRSFELDESRRMRSTEIHYLDHPYFGIVAVVTPYEIPEPPVDQTGVKVLPAPKSLNP